MKLRLTILVVVLSMFLASCTLAEDITPPANYVAPTTAATTVPTAIPATQTPVPPATNTSIPTVAAATTDATTVTTETTPGATDLTPAVTGEVTPAAEASPTAQTTWTVSGTVTGFVGGVPADATAVLLMVDPTSGQIANTQTAPIQADGTYSMTDVPAETAFIYLVTINYKEVTYESAYSQYDGTKTQLDLPVAVFDSTADMNVLTIAQAHMQLDFSTAGQIKVMALYVITNPGTSSVIITSDGSSVPFIQVPAGATDVGYQLAQSSSQLMNATGGFAMLPGADKQYAIIATFNLPYTKSLEIAQPFVLPVTSATFIVPEGIKIKSDQLTDAGTQNSSSTPPVVYHLYQASSLASGSTLTLTVSGAPGDKTATGFVLNQNTWLIIGVAAVGLLLIGLGIFLFLRDRKLRLEEEEDEEEGAEEGAPVENTDALGEDRVGIMDAIIALDDKFQAGEISKEAYEQRRAELKDRLKNLA
jgi:hypothetical protein